MHRTHDTLSLLGRVFALWLGVGFTASAEDAAPRVDLRGAITRGLGYLAREGDKWMDERDCNSCHHLPQLVWSHREAKRRGFAIDDAKLEEFSEWADERADKTQSGTEMIAFLRLGTSEQPRPDLVKQIVEAQQADGSWKLAGQFTAQWRDVKESAESSARLFLIALVTDTDRTAAETARAKAAPLLSASAPAKSANTLAMRLLFAQRFGEAAAVDSVRAELLKAQLADGGWSWMLAEPQSDPLATGEVLYALHQAPDAAAADAIARAQAWLVSQQHEDGSWPIDFTRISKKDRSAPGKEKSFKEATGIYTYWGSAWATLGLLHGVPVAEH